MPREAVRSRHVPTSRAVAASIRPLPPMTPPPPADILLARVVVAPSCCRRRICHPMPRTAHYVISTHWDREWYEPLQGYRMRLVSLLDEVFDTFERDPPFSIFTMDGQYIPIADYLEVRPERAECVRRYVKQGRLKVGPWYVLPDEWLVSGESLIRNIQLGLRLSSKLGAPPSRAGFACDLFGHISQLPQLFQQLGIPFGYVWRGTYEREHKGHLNWQSPDGTVLPAYRF